MTGTGKSYSVKEWFANKIANEIKCNITACDVFAILKETEKAVYAMCYVGWMRKVTKWIPKSCLEAHEIGPDEMTMMHYETMRTDDYEEAAAAFRYHCSLFN